MKEAILSDRDADRASVIYASPVIQLIPASFDFIVASANLLPGETFAQFVKLLRLWQKRRRVSVASPLWVHVPSRKRPVFAGMTWVVRWSLTGEVCVRVTS